MHKKLFTVLWVALLATAVLMAQDAQKKPIITDIPGNAIESVSAKGYNGPAPVTAANYVEVDLMPNVYGPAIGVINPAAYDPASNTNVIVYRGNTAFAAGSGELWYSYSTDKGATWTRSANSINGLNSQILSRYPSAALINAGSSTNMEDLIAVFAWPELDATAGGFQHVGYGADQGIDGPDFAAITDDGATTSTPLYSSQVPIFTHVGSDGTGYIFWASDNQDNADITIWRTTDYSDITTQVPTHWTSTAFDDGGNITLGGASVNGVAYYGAMGTFNDQYGFTATTFGGWGLGYSKSEDNGETWSEWNLVDWTAIEATAEYNEIWDYVKDDEFVSYQGDINVDKDGYVHIVSGMTAYDTLVSTEYGKNAIVEFFEDGAGWDAKIIVDDETLVDSTFTQIEGAALGQMGPSVYLAFDEDREFMMAQWVTHTNADSFFCDIYASYRHIDDAEWAAAMNLTETSNLNENSTHFAPSLAKTDLGNGEVEYTGFSFYCYPQGVNYGYFDSNGDEVVLPTPYYAAAVNVTYGTNSVENEVDNNFSYNLSQNYPNPFNPSTSIKYEIANTANVTLKVYDVLGAEVATLVNKVQAPGSYTATFDASRLTSGVYIYEITAGDFVKSAKMMLLK